MNIHRVLGRLALVAAFATGSRGIIAQGANLIGASSRVEHGKASFEVPLPLDQSGIEPRNLRHGTTLVLTFDRPVSDVSVRLTDGRATLGPPTIDGRTATVPVSGLVDGREVTVSIQSGSGEFATRRLSVRTLQGDVNGDAIVDAADAQLVRQNLGKTTDATARFDVLTSGAVDASDVKRVTTRIGINGIGPAVRNTPPAITAIPTQKMSAERIPPGIGFHVSDKETAPSQLRVWAVSGDPQILPSENIRFSGTDSLRVLTAQNAPGRYGPVTVTVFVSDGLAQTSTSFVNEIEAAPTLFITQMTPQGAAQSTGSGNATLLVAGDELSAVLRFSFSNLTGPETAAHIHGPADPGQSAGILFDIDTATPNADGSYTWTIVPTGGFSIADQVNFIRQGKTYINIHTAAYPNGEIRGQFSLASGSQTFTPPAAPPALPALPPTADEAARFLTQATFGPTESDIQLVTAMGYAAWIEDQFRRPQTKVLDYVLARAANGEVPDNNNMLVEGWWSGALTGEDQLRQRVAFALSQIFVISQQDGDLNGRPRECAYYYDMLSRNAFGNYRTLLEDVTLNPEMGEYLDMRANRKASGSQIPNENYGREILQLLSIGLYALHPDGTLKLGVDGLPIATYGQAEVTGFSRVFTGWNWHQAAQSSNPASDYFNPMTLVVNDHEFGSKQLLDGVLIPPRTATSANALLDLADAHNQLFNHPNTGPFICKQLIQRLVTDNPSPGYVYRVSQVFADNGRGIRGDLKAVVKAILLDYEARAGYDLAKYPNSPVYNQGYGKLREPLLRATAMARAFRPSSATGLFRVTATDAAFLQAPLRSPSVFNFFEPSYSHPGSLATAGLLSPEFQILNEITAVSTANFLENATRNALQGGDVRLDFSVEQALAVNPTALVDRLNLLLMYGQMSPTMRTTIINHVTSLPATTDAQRLERARAAVHLIVTSSEFAAQR